MKLNLPSTWTSEKITSLIFLTWLSADQVNAGQAFKNCLIDRNNNNATIYDLLLNYPLASESNIISGEILSLCCANNSCASCPFNGSSAGCVKINSLIFCRVFLLFYRGIIGDSPITGNATLGGRCGSSSLSSVSDYLATVPAKNFTGLEQGYAYYVCPSGSPCSSFRFCNWDNGGWICSSIRDIVNDSCFLQWTAPWPGPADKNPSTFTLSVTTSLTISPSSSTHSSTSTTTPTSVPFPTDNNHEGLSTSDKIALGTGIGIGVPGFIVSLVTLWFTVPPFRKLVKKCFFCC